MKLKQLLFLTHRWMGVGMCLLFAMWFATGIIMMYVEYPELTEQERLANLPPLQVERVSVPVERAMMIAGVDGGSAQIILSTVADRPAWLFRNVDGRLRTVFADTGGLLHGPTSKQVLATVRSSGFIKADMTPVYDARIEDDQWTVSSVLHEHRPLHRVIVGDEAGTVVYVSDITGQIVRDTDRRERIWNWLGSTLHWIYPVQLRRHQELWVQVIIYLSLAGIISVITGAIIGFMMLRLKKRYKGSSISPYRGVDKWHHVTGLICLVFITTYIFSGLMSMGPWGIFDSPTSARQQVERYTGGVITDPGNFPTLDPSKVPVGTREVEWVQVMGHGHLVLSLSASDRRVMAGQEQAVAHSETLQQEIREAMPVLIPDSNVVSVETLADYDDYYYSRHNRYRPLPVFRVKFDDPESTWFHINRNTGTVVTRLTDATRLERWLYNGLHSLDFNFLTSRGILWDITVILLSIAGFGFSVTSVIVGWKRLTGQY